MLCLRDSTAFISCVVLLLVAQSSHGSEIIGGREVDPPHSLPYMAWTGKPFCGGILIDKNWVLTAAHCAVALSIKQVFLGVHSIKEDEMEKKSRQVCKVKQSFPHPCFDNETMVNDLMLLKLAKPAKLTETVKLLPLGKAVKDPPAGTRCLVAGWGVTNTATKKLSNVLRSVNVTVIDRVKCNSPEYYGGRYVITKSMICAGSDGKRQTDTCQGDSGGPIVCNGELVGVTSFGIGCGRIDKPGVYSFLTEKQLSWIKKTMKKSEI